MSITIDKIMATDTASADTFNRPLFQIEAALNKLQETVSRVSSKSCIIYNNAPVSSDCFIGALVYLDEDDHIMKPARAVHYDTPTESGRYIDSHDSHVVGMVISKSGNIADILISGSYDSPACITGCGITEGPGTYYLSEDTAGKCTKNPPVTMRTPVLTYVGGSSLILNITSRPPYQYDSPLIRGLVSDNDYIVVSSDDTGLGHVGMNESVVTATSFSPVAVSSISGRYCTVTPVISSISGLGGVSTTTNEFGEAVIELTSEKGGISYASEYNLNGSKRVSDDIYTYIVFPKGKESRLTVSTHVNAPIPMTAKAWAHVIQSETLDIAIKSAFIPDPSKDTGVNISDIEWSNGAISVEGQDGNLIMCEGSNSVYATGSGTVVTVLTVANPNTDIRLLRAGVTMSPVSNNVVDPALDFSSLQASLRAAENIKKDSLVGITENNELVNASCDNPSVPVVGIALNTVTTGDICKYTTSGYHRTDNSLKHGSVYFVGLNGELTNTVPDMPNYAQKIGEAVGTTTLRIDIEERII